MGEGLGGGDGRCTVHRCLETAVGDGVIATRETLGLSPPPRPAPIEGAGARQVDRRLLKWIEKSNASLGNISNIAGCKGEVVLHRRRDELAVFDRHSRMKRH